jgi:hypothetical protein
MGRAVTVLTVGHSNRSLDEALPDDVRHHWVRELGGRRHTPAGQPTGNGCMAVKAFRYYALCMPRRDGSGATPRRGYADDRCSRVPAGRTTRMGATSSSHVTVS